MSSQTKANDIPASSNSSSKTPIAGYVRLRKGIDFGQSNCFDYENQVKALATELVAPQTLKHIFVTLVDPCQTGQTPIKTQTLLNCGQARTVAEPTPLVLAGVFPGRVTVDSSGFNLLSDFQFIEYRQVSATNASNVLGGFATRGLKSCAIYMTTSAGTATLTVEGSPDGGSNFITIDSVAAAAATAKQYDDTHLGTTIALNPMLFPFVRVTAGTAGSGNTTTLIFVAK